MVAMARPDHDASSTDRANMSSGGRNTFDKGDNMSAGGRDMLVAAADDHLAAALPWIAGHCRFVTTNLPRGVVGVSVAAQLLAALPDACRRRVPDLTGSGPEVFSKAVEYGLLTQVPSARVIRSEPKLIAKASPIFRRRGQRHWTLWIVHLLDDDMLARIKKLTPPSQLRVCAPIAGVTPRSRGELATAHQELTTALAAERSGRAQEREQLATLKRQLEEKSSALAGVLSAAAENAEHLRDAERELARFRQRHKEAADLRAEVAQLEREVERLRDAHASALADKGKLTAELARAIEANEALAKRLRDLGQTADILDLASGIGRVLFRSKKDP